MKKILLSVLTFMATFMTASAQSSDLSSLTDAVYVQPLNAPAGSQQTLSVRMKNSIIVQTIQFDLYLPEGITIVPNDDGLLMTASKERINRFNYFESELQTDGALRLLAQATTTNVPVGDGEIAKVIVSIDNAMTLGDYPITVKEILLVSADNESKNVEEVSTTITIEAPVDSRIVLDEASTTVPEAATGVDVRVKRTIYANEWSTLVLPFDMTEAQVYDVFGDDVQLAEYMDHEMNADATEITINFDEALLDEDGLIANNPYIIKTSKDIEEFTVDGVTIDPDEVGAIAEFTNGRTGSRKEVYGTFQGTYHAQTVVPENCLFLNGSKFWYSTGLTKMKAFRAYLNLVHVLASVEGAGSRIHLNFKDNSTGINETVNRKTAEGKCFDLQGRRVLHAGKGIYIENGKKVVK